MPRLPLVALLLAALTGMLLVPAFSSDTPGAPAVEEMSAQGIEAIARGLEWLARNQEADGSYEADVGYKLNTGYKVTAPGVSHPGVTALAGMAFLAGGHVPGRGKYGENVARVVDYILDCVSSDGMITDNGSRMYSHAFGTLFLAEVYGMTQNAEVKAALQRATEFTWKCQNRTGAWRYSPFAQDSDMSITVCQVMALRAARNIGIRVPKETIDRAVTYVLQSANTDPMDDPGSFMYQWREHDPIATRASFALTAAGLATLFHAGLYTDRDILDHIREHRVERFLRAEAPPRIEPILDYLRRTYATTTKRHYFYYYGNYYAVQAMFIAGGENWDWYYRAVQADLVDQQLPDGSWPIVTVGPAYATASACLILQIPFRYLPIFQR